MKTVSDVAAFLKRNPGHALLVEIGRDGSFRVECGIVGVADHEKSTSKHLDDALENLAESMRRKANGMAPARDVIASPSNPSACVSVCPTCLGLPASWTEADKLKLVCNRMHFWTTKPAIGAVYWFDVIMFGKQKFKWDGAEWGAVP